MSAAAFEQSLIVIADRLLLLAFTLFSASVALKQEISALTIGWAIFLGSSWKFPLSEENPWRKGTSLFAQ
jgi:hypothetical protein